MLPRLNLTASSPQAIQHPPAQRAPSGVQPATMEAPPAPPKREIERIQGEMARLANPLANAIAAYRSNTPHNPRPPTANELRSASLTREMALRGKTILTVSFEEITVSDEGRKSKRPLECSVAVPAAEIADFKTQCTKYQELSKQVNIEIRMATMGNELIRRKISENIPRPYLVPTILAMKRVSKDMERSFLPEISLAKEKVESNIKNNPYLNPNLQSSFPNILGQSPDEKMKNTLAYLKFALREIVALGTATSGKSSVELFIQLSQRLGSLMNRSGIGRELMQQVWEKHGHRWCAVNIADPVQRQSEIRLVDESKAEIIFSLSKYWNVKSDIDRVKKDFSQLFDLFNSIQTSEVRRDERLFPSLVDIFNARSQELGQEARLQLVEYLQKNPDGLSNETKEKFRRHFFLISRPELLMSKEELQYDIESISRIGGEFPAIHDFISDDGVLRTQHDEVLRNRFYETVLRMSAQKIAGIMAMVTHLLERLVKLGTKITGNESIELFVALSNNLLADHSRDGVCRVLMQKTWEQHGHVWCAVNMNKPARCPEEEVILMDRKRAEVVISLSQLKHWKCEDSPQVKTYFDKLFKLFNTIQTPEIKYEKCGETAFLQLIDIYDEHALRLGASSESGASSYHNLARYLEEHQGNLSDETKETAIRRLAAGLFRERMPDTWEEWEYVAYGKMDPETGLVFNLDEIRDDFDKLFAALQNIRKTEVKNRLGSFYAMIAQYENFPDELGPERFSIFFKYLEDNPDLSDEAKESWITVLSSFLNPISNTFAEHFAVLCNVGISIGNDHVKAEVATHLIEKRNEAFEQVRPNCTQNIERLVANISDDQLRADISAQM